MINLLPPTEKKQLKLEKKIKLLVIFGLVFLIFLICLILSLFSIKTYIQAQVEAEGIVLEEIKQELETSNSKGTQQIIKNYNEKLIKLKRFYSKQVYFTTNLRKVLDLTPSAIYFENLSFKKEKQATSVTISGFSPTRDILTSFRERMEQEESITEINFSPLSWAKPKNIDFSVNFKIKK